MKSWENTGCISYFYKISKSKKRNSPTDRGKSAILKNFK